MIDDERRRDQVATLRQFAVDLLKNYSGGFAGLERLTRNLDSIIDTLQDIADPTWTSSLLRHWDQLEIIYALKLDNGRLDMTQEEETEVRGIVAGLLAEFHGYEVPLYPEDKPKEVDVVRLRRDLPEHNLPAGSTGTVVVDYTNYSDGALPPEYEVEIADPEGGTQAMVTVSEEHLEVVSRPEYGGSPS